MCKETWWDDNFGEKFASEKASKDWKVSRPVYSDDDDFVSDVDSDLNVRKKRMCVAKTTPKKCKDDDCRLEREDKLDVENNNDVEGQSDQSDKEFSGSESESDAEDSSESNCGSGASGERQSLDIDSSSVASVVSNSAECDNLNGEKSSLASYLEYAEYKSNSTHSFRTPGSDSDGSDFPS